MPPIINKIAIVKLSAMGDIIHSMVALQYIKNRFPKVEIDWVVEASFAQILENNPYIDRIHKIDLKETKRNKFTVFKQIARIRKLSKNQYDLVIDAQGLIKSAVVSRLLKSEVAGFDKESIREKLASKLYTKKVNISYQSNTIDRNAKVLSAPLGFNISNQDILNKEPLLYFKGEDKAVYEYLSNKRKNIVFIISSTWKSRNYPKRKFANIANELKENCLVVWNGDEEKEKAQWIEDNSPFAKIAPKMNLDMLKAFIAKSDLLIGNDTGPTHMAWALNVPSITIFGPTPINRTYQTPINKTIKSDSIVNHDKLDKNDFSIREIDENSIINLSKQLLGR